MGNRKRKPWIQAVPCILITGLLLGGCGNSKKGYGAGSGSETDSASAYENAGWENSAETAEGADDQKADEEAGTDAGADAVKVTDRQNEKLIYTYRYSVETKAFDTFVQTVTEKVQKLGGYVESSETNGSALDASGRSASMTLRIPADQTDELLTLVRKESNVVYDNVSSENVTLRYVDLESHVRALRTEQKTLLRLIEKAEKIEDVIALQSQLTQVRYEIESYESRLRTMDNLVSYSTLHLDIAEVQRTTTVTDQKASFGEEVKNRFSDNLYAVGQWLRNFLIGLIGSLPVLVPLALAAALPLYLMRRRGRRRKEQMPSRDMQGGYQSIYQRTGSGQNVQNVQNPEKEQTDVEESDTL